MLDPAGQTGDDYSTAIRVRGTENTYAGPLWLTLHSGSSPSPGTTSKSTPRCASYRKTTDILLLRDGRSFLRNNFSSCRNGFFFMLFCCTEHKCPRPDQCSSFAYALSGISRANSLERQEHSTRFQAASSSSSSLPDGILRLL